jgi:hypothetical protein
LTTSEESMALTGVGAAAWKSGCQKWKGKAALLIRKVAVRNAMPAMVSGAEGLEAMRAARSARLSVPCEMYKRADA